MGVWHGEALWSSSGRRSRKARNLAADPRCVVTTDDAQNPVVVEGRAELVAERRSIERVAALMSEKYGAISADFLAEHALMRVTPTWVFGLSHDDFTGSPTRWTFAAD